MSMNVKAPKPVAGPPTLLKNVAASPFIYFDTVPCFGVYAGNVEVELGARVLLPRSDGQTVVVDLASVAHLRCSANAAMALIDALTRALDMTKQQGEPAKPLDS